MMLMACFLPYIISGVSLLLPAGSMSDASRHGSGSSHCGFRLALLAKPLTLILPPPASCEAEVASPPLPPTTSTPIPDLQWDRAKKDKYKRHMKDCRAAHAGCCSKVHAKMLDRPAAGLPSAWQQMFEAASEAGCQKFSWARASKGIKGKA